MGKMITEEEKDLLIELFNVGIGKASASLAIISKQEIDVSVPKLNIVPYKKFISGLRNQEFCCVIQRSHGALNAVSALIFPQDGSFEIIRRMLGKHLDISSNPELYQDAIREVGNIMLNACIGSIARTLNMHIETELPILLIGSPNNMIDDVLTDSDDMLLDVTIDIHLMESNIKGSIVFIMGPLSLSNLKHGLEPILHKITPEQ